MATNIFIFHGTEGHPKENRFPWLKAQLENSGNKVLVPQFPSPPGQPAHVAEWFRVLRDYEQYINAETILIGHSLGGLFALRVLEKLTHPIKASFFVAAPIGIKPFLNYDKDNVFCGFTFDWQKIKQNAGRATVYHSDDDSYVGLKNGKELSKNLGVDLTFISNAGHFNTLAGYTTFPDLLDKVDVVLQD